MSEKNHLPQTDGKPERHHAGLYGKLRDAGMLNEVSEMIRRGDTLQKVSDYCNSKGFPSTTSNIFRIRQRLRVEWDEAAFRQAAIDANIEGATDDGTSMELLIDRTMVAKFSVLIATAEGAEVLTGLMSAWTSWKRLRVAERAEARAERAEDRQMRELSKQVAIRFLDMLNSEDLAAKARAIRDGVAVDGGGIEKQVEAIQSFLWGDVFNVKEAA